MTAAGAAYMASTSPVGHLTDALLISPDSTSPAWHCADGTSPGTIQGITFSGAYTVTGDGVSPKTFDLHANQYVEFTDVAATYTDTITFTAGFTP